MTEEVITKGAILTAGIGLITTGALLIEQGNLESGCILILVGFGLVGVFVYLLDKDVTKSVLRKIVKMMDDGETKQL